MTQIPHDLMTAILDNPADDLPRLIVAAVRYARGEWERHALTAPRNEMRA